jgi:hypothetical protein
MVLAQALVDGLLPLASIRCGLLLALGDPPPLRTAQLIHGDGSTQRTLARLEDGLLGLQGRPAEGRTIGGVG